jgi:hypothetical protein
MQIEIQSKPRPNDRRLCPGSDLVLPSDLVDMSNHTAICPDCGERVGVWLSESWYRQEHWEQVNAEHQTAAR